MRNGVARHSGAAADFGNVADACGLAQAVPAALLTTPCCSDWPNSRIPKRGSETPCRSLRFLTTPSSSRSVPSSIRPVFGWGGFFASESRGWGSRCARRTRRHGVVRALSASAPEPTPESAPEPATEVPAAGKCNACCAAAHTSSKPKGRSACPPLVRMSDR